MAVTLNVTLSPACVVTDVGWAMMVSGSSIVITAVSLVTVFPLPSVITHLTFQPSQLADGVLVMDADVALAKLVHFVLVLPWYCH